MNKVSIKNHSFSNGIQKNWNEMNLVQKWVDMTDEDIARTLGTLKERRRSLWRKSMKNRKSVDY